MPALEHSWNNWQINAIDPTETEDSKNERTCNRNGCNSKETTLNTDLNTIEYATGTTGLTFGIIGAPEVTACFARARINEGAISGTVRIPRYHRPLGSSDYLPVTGIGEFQNQVNITEVLFLAPSNITGILSSAFNGCTGLTSITIPDSVTRIDSSAFAGCTGLTSITIPDRVTSIGSSAFNGCTGLTSVVIPNSVTSIGVSAFLGCISLTRITIPNSVTTIADNTFNGCSALMDVVIPNNVTNIGGNAFWGCTELTSITIPNSVTNIGAQAFRSTGLTNVTIHATAPPILGANAFQSTPQDLRIYVPVGRAGTYRTTPGWDGIRNRIHIVDCTLENATIGNVCSCA
jgi:hypothetical protein